MGRKCCFHSQRAMEHTPRYVSHTRVHNDGAIEIERLEKRQDTTPHRPILKRARLVEAQWQESRSMTASHPCERMHTTYTQMLCVGYENNTCVPLENRSI